MYIGDYQEDSTSLVHKFTTRNTTGEASALSGSPGPEVWKYNSTTPSTAGMTLTSSFGSKTGLNQIEIDLSSTAFYAAGEDYAVVMSSGNVNAVDISNEVVFQFSIENRFSTEAVMDALSQHGASTHTTTDIFDQSKNAISTNLSTIADVVWDELLTGAAHNVTNSAGKRLRTLQESGAAYGGYIWIDTVNGAAGTDDYINGTSDNPTSTIAAALTLSASVGIDRFRVAPGSSITFAAAFANKVMEGYSYTLELGGQSIDGSTIKGATISGIGTNSSGTQYIIDCLFGATSTLPGDTHVVGSGINGTITVGEAGDYFFDNCHSAVAGNGTPVLDINSVANVNISWRHYSGGLQVNNAAATTTMSYEADGQIVVAASCTSLNLTIRGNCSLTDSGTTTSITDDARVTIDSIWDEDVDTSHQTAGSAGKKLDDAGAAGDPWGAAVPSTYAAGTAGYIMGNQSTHGTTEIFDQAKNAISTASVASTADLATALSNYGASTHTTTDILDQAKNAITTASVASTADLATALSNYGASTVSSGVMLNIATTALETHGASTHTASQVMTAAMTEAYSTGSTPTPAELLFAVNALLTNFTIISSVLTAYKIGTTVTTAATFELNDSTAPTAIKRTG